MGNMELGERGGEFTKRPEIDQYGPMGIFQYADAKLQWYKQRQPENEWPTAALYLAEEMDKYVYEFFGQDRPDLIVQASDVLEPDLHLSDGSQQLATKPRVANEHTSLIGEHTFNAKLQGFHVGQTGDLRVYVQQANPVVLKTPAGILAAFTSVAVEGSDIQLAVQKESDLYEQIGRDIIEHVAEYDPKVKQLVQSLIRTLSEPTEPLYRRLQLSSGIIGDIAGSKTTQQFVDTIMELVSLKLRLASGVTLLASSHRVKIPSETTRGYIIVEGRRQFERVSVTPELIRNGASNTLGLTFYDEKDVITVPVHDIESLTREVRDSE